MELQHAKALAALRWRGMRKEPNNLGWAQAFIDHMALQGKHSLEEVTGEDLRAYMVECDMQELAPATVYARMSVVSVLYDEAVKDGYRGEVPTTPYPHVPRKAKWWLNPDAQREVIRWCKTHKYRDLGDMIRWTVLTGLRIEESLRVTKGSFLGLASSEPSLLIAGTKTKGAEATLPLALEAARLAHTRFPARATSVALLFNVTYLDIWSQWQTARSALGWPSNATLKALRRSYARDRAAKGCPLPVLQQMMRHGTPQTTMEYLRLTGGGFTTEEQRRWV
jgi:integrase